MYKFLYSFESNVSWSFLAAGIKKSLPYPSECLDLFGEQQILNIFLESVEGLGQLQLHFGGQTNRKKLWRFNLQPTRSLSSRVDLATKQITQQ